MIKINNYVKAMYVFNETHRYYDIRVFPDFKFLRIIATNLSLEFYKEFDIAYPVLQDLSIKEIVDMYERFCIITESEKSKIMRGEDKCG